MANQQKEFLKSKIIYILRHGETEYNKLGRVQGRGIDASLNEKGREQARKTYLALKKVPFDLVVTSSLRRTHETVALFLEQKIQHLSLAGLDEISWGNQEGVEATPETKNLYEQTVSRWRNGELDCSVGGGETPIRVMERQQRAMKAILDRDEQCVLICMHGRAIRILLCWLLHYPLRMMDGFAHSNCGYYRLSFAGGAFAVNEHNVQSHLH